MSWVTFVLLLFIAQGVVLSVFVLLENRHPMATLAWVLMLCLLPFVGAVLYYFFGRRRFHKRRKFRAKALEPLLHAHRHRNPHRELEGNEIEVKVQTASYEALPAAAANAQGVSATTRATAQNARRKTQSYTAFQARHEPPKTPAPPPAAQYRPTVVPATQRDSIPVIDLASHIIPAPLTDDNSATILHNGEETYAAIEAAIRRAKHHIHVMYYIVREDHTGMWLRDLLIQRAQEGLEIRFLYDAIGCYSTSNAFFQPLRDAGAAVAEFMPVRLSWPLRKSYVNFRNHRKLVVIDGVCGFTGGINIGDEYRGKDPAHGHWRDDHIQIDGPAVHYLQHVFVEDWCHVTDEVLASPLYFPFEELPQDAMQPNTKTGKGKTKSKGKKKGKRNKRNKRKQQAPNKANTKERNDKTITIQTASPEQTQKANANESIDSANAVQMSQMRASKQDLIQTYVDSETHKAMLQIVPSGPDQAWYSIRLLFFAAIASAREQVWMTTPYFVPDGAILTAITSTALRGVDVRLLLPAKGDNPLVRFAGRSYYRRLLQAGVRIYEYQRGMLHAKTMVVDHHYGTIGSANLDMRSFHINFEINAFVYEEVFARQLEAQFLEDIKDAQEIERVAFSKRSLKDRLLEASARIFSPLL